MTWYKGWWDISKNVKGFGCQKCLNWWKIKNFLICPEGGWSCTQWKSCKVKKWKQKDMEPCVPSAAEIRSIGVVAPSAATMTHTRIVRKPPPAPPRFASHLLQQATNPRGWWTRGGVRGGWRPTTKHQPRSEKINPRTCQMPNVAKFTGYALNASMIHAAPV